MQNLSTWWFGEPCHGDVYCSEQKDVDTCDPRCMAFCANGEQCKNKGLRGFSMKYVPSIIAYPILAAYKAAGGVGDCCLFCGVHIKGMASRAAVRAIAASQTEEGQKVMKEGIKMLTGGSAMTRKRRRRRKTARRPRRTPVRRRRVTRRRVTRPRRRTRRRVTRRRRPRRTPVRRRRTARRRPPVRRRVKSRIW